MTWSWSDHGAGGSFTPSAAVAAPAYTAPANTSDQAVTITLTATATSAGPPPVASSADVSLTVMSVSHSLTVTASANPVSVASQGSTSLSAAATDSLGHGVTWSWTDHGAGGAFSPSSTVAAPTYTAPANTSGHTVTVTLTATATCDGSRPVTATADVSLTVAFVPHTLSVTATGDPLSVASQGSTTLHATATDSLGHAVAWSWSDHGAGGSFAPSATVAAPTYTAPANISGLAVTVTLTAAATCDGPQPLTATADVLLTVASVPHTLTVTATGDPLSVASQGSTNLHATATDSLGHGVAWSWTDHGAGGNFSPSAAVDAPTYTAPANTTSQPVSITLTATATCNGPEPASSSADVVVTVTPVNLGGTGEIAGHTCDFRTGQPLSGVTVRVQSAEGAQDTEILTDDTGAYDFAGLPAETDYRVTTSLADYYAETAGPLAVAPGQVTSAELTLLHEFSDVPPSFWVYAEVGACVRSRIVSGYADGSYGPGLQVTRATMAVFMARAMAGGDALVPTGPAQADFPDVSTDYWAYRYIEYAFSQHVVAGYGDGSYSPEGIVDRGQMAVFVARAIVTPRGEAGLADFTPPATPSFLDVPTTFWSFKHIEYIKSRGIVSGYSDGTYHPEFACTRDQMAAYVYRAFGLPPE